MGVMLPDGLDIDSSQEIRKFPIRTLDGNEEVWLTLEWRASVYTKDNEFLGFINFPPFSRDHDGYWDCMEFLFKFTKRDSKCFWLKFKTLLVVQRLVEKDLKQFKQVLRTAKDEEEFCILAGMG